MRRLRDFIVCVCLLAGSGAGADPLDTLAEKTSLSGTFTQVILSPEGAVLEQAEGRFQLLRPHYFWWQIENPDQQLLIAVDDELTQIDWDLEVMTRRAFTPQDRTVLQWLLSSREDIESAFSVEADQQAAVLIARDGNAPVTQLKIEHLPDEALWRLTMTDRGEQVIAVTLVEDAGRELRPTDFTPPAMDFE